MTMTTMRRCDAQRCLAAARTPEMLAKSNVCSRTASNAHTSGSQTIPCTLADNQHTPLKNSYTNLGVGWWSQNINTKIHTVSQRQTIRDTDGKTKKKRPACVCVAENIADLMPRASDVVQGAVGRARHTHTKAIADRRRVDGPNARTKNL